MFPELNVSDILYKNMIQRARREVGLAPTGNEVQGLINYFFSIRNNGEDCYFAINVDDSGRCDRIFFMSAYMRDTFRRNGQFILLDSTCKTNRFGMALVLLVGVNQAVRTVIFGIGLLISEDIPSYQWLLTHAKQAIGHKVNTLTYIRVLSALKRSLKSRYIYVSFPVFFLVLFFVFWICISTVVSFVLSLVLSIVNCGVSRVVWWSVSVVDFLVLFFVFRYSSVGPDTMRSDRWGCLFLGAIITVVASYPSSAVQMAFISKHLPKPKTGTGIGI